MGFEPFSGEHAIQRVGFGCILSEPLDVTALRQVRDRRGEIQAALPAISFSETGEPWLQFGHLRPNGNPTWALRLSGTAIYVENTRYTRWERTWAQAKEFLDFALNSIPSDATMVVGGGLKVTDRFRSPLDNYNLRDLFVENDLIPKHVFNHGHKWRLDYEWADAFDGGESSSNLEISTKTSRRADRGDNETKIFVSVIIDHIQEYALQQPLSLADAMNSETGGIANYMEKFHRDNKICIGNITTNEIKQKIKLWGDA